MIQHEELAYSSPTGKKRKAQWDDIQRAYLLKLLSERGTARWRAQNAWTKATWLEITKLFNEKFPNANYSRDQIKEQEQGIKKTYKVLKRLSKLSGFGWDYVNNVVTASDDAWRPLLEADKDAKKWHRKSWPFYAQCEELYEGRFVEGKRCSALEDYKESSHQSSVGETSSSPTIPAFGDTKAPFDWEQELEPFNDANLDPHCRHDLPTAPPHPSAPSQAPSQKSSQMSQRSAIKRRRKNSVILDAFTERYMSLKEKESEQFFASRPKGDNVSTGDYCIPRCIEVLKEMECLTEEEMVDACDLFLSYEKRTIFLTLDSAIREIWVKKHLKGQK